MKSLNKLKRVIGKNKQLFTGLAIGALIMLPMGLYLTERANNNQSIETPETTTKVPSTTEKTIKEATPQPVATPAPAPQPATQQQATITQQRTRGVDCVGLNKTEQALVTEGEASNYNYYLSIKNTFANSDEATRSIETTKAYNNYTTWVNKSKYTADGIIRDAGCTSTITINLRPKV